MIKKSICKDELLCTGCTACASICPKNCITMLENEEGFLYPQIDQRKCTYCNACSKICPVNHPPQKYEIKGSYVGRYVDTDVVMASTSGGMCTAFAKYTFRQNGVIYGAGYDNEMKVNHMAVYSDLDIIKIRGSKYVQSSLNHCLEEIKALLDGKHFVCFIGTPCQVAGLKSFLKQEYSNLLTVDLVCHGVSSPKLFSQYVDYLKEKYNSDIEDIRFRNKTYGYHSGTMKVQFSSGKVYYGSARVDYMLKAYFSGACSRYSCYQCPFKGKSRCSDFTIFDSWHIDSLIQDKQDDDKGYTNIYVHTDKGIKALQEISEDLKIWKADQDKMQLLDGIMIDNNPTMNSCRMELRERIDKVGFYLAMQECLPVRKKDYILENLKGIAYKMGILGKIK